MTETMMGVLVLALLALVTAGLWTGLAHEHAVPRDARHLLRMRKTIRGG